MKKIVFVCLGNICRSPMAEFVMKDLIKREKLSEKISVLSAGTSGENDGCSAHFGTKNELEKHGILIKNFVSKKLSQKICDEFDLIITMDEANFNYVLKNFKNINGKLFGICDFANLSYKEVPDPYYSGDFSETYEIISAGCANLLQKIKSEI